MKTATSVRSNPYVGPRAFEPGERLYGRDREVLHLLDLLIAERIVLLYSRSGAGKTSLIQAALMPELDKKRFHILPVMRVGHEPPPGFTLPSTTNRYILSLLLSLEEGVPDERRLPLAELADMTLPAYLARREDEAGESGRLILIFDQFEEILVYPTDQDAKEEFFRQVGDALQDRRRWALFSMREDYLAGLDSFKSLLPTRLRATYRLDLLGEDAARTAICEPARQAGVEFGDETVHKLVNDLRLVRVQQRDGTIAEQLGPYIEPVQLQVVCQTLWESLPPEVNLITPEHLRTFGDVNQALSGFYERAIRRATQGTRVTDGRLRDWFGDILITPAGTRGTVYRGREDTGKVPNAAVDILENLHLIRGEWRSGARWYELTHDRFIGPIQRSNAAWHAARRARRQRVGLGGLLCVFIGWVALTVSSGGSASVPDQQLRAAATRQEVRLSEAVATGTASAAEALQAAATATTESRQVATQIAATATASAAEVSQLTADFSRKRIRPIKPGLSAASVNSTAGSLGAFVRDAQGSFYVLQSLGVNTAGASVVQPGPVDGGKDPDDTIGYIDRTLPLTGSVLAANMVGLVRLAEGVDFETSITGIGPVLGVRPPAVGMRVRKLGRTTGLTTSEIQQIGRTISLSLGDRGTVVLNNAIMTGPMSEGGDGGALVVDGDGYAVGIIVGGSQISSVLAPIQDVLDAYNVQMVSVGQELFALRGHDKRVLTAAWSPDGTQIASGGDDGTVRLWDVATRAQARLLAGHAAPVRSVAWSPDGKRLASGSEDDTVRIWDVSTGRETPLLVLNAEDKVRSVAWSPDGLKLAAGIANGSVQVWDSDGGPLTPSRGHINAVNTVAWSPDGRLGASGGDDGAAFVLDTVTGKSLTEAKLSQGISSVAWSPDSTRLALGSWDNTIRVWDVLKGSAPSLIGTHDKFVRSVAWSPDGTQLVSASADGTARVWDVLNKTMLYTLTGHTGEVFSATWSSDGTRIVTASADSTLRIWQAK